MIRLDLRACFNLSRFSLFSTTHSEACFMEAYIILAMVDYLRAEIFSQHSFLGTLCFSLKNQHGTFRLKILEVATFYKSYKV